MGLLDQLNPGQGAGYTYPYLRETVRNNGKYATIGNQLDAAKQIGILTLTSRLGIPQASTAGILNLGVDTTSNYNSVPFVNLNKIPSIKYQDFRSRKGINIESLIGKRLDGARAAINRGNTNRALSAAYAAASATVGAYSLFNRDGNKWFGAGWGDHGNPVALRSDFTAESHIATRWNTASKKWVAKTSPQVQATPFLGDRVQVVDFRKGTLRNVYEWKTVKKILGAQLPNYFNQTQDFIKFFLTGPRLAPNTKDDVGEDEIIVFRAAITSLTDSFAPQWTPVKYIGRADSNYQYESYSRTLNLNFEVYATDRDEMKPIWRKLNALAGYTAPTYNPNSIALEAPWMRMTIGDLFYQQPVVISSLSYTLHGTNTNWEINVENDSTMMEAPQSVTVQMTLSLITNELPQRGGKFYTLAKRFDEFGEAKAGNDNWLSDFKDNIDAEVSKLDALGDKATRKAKQAARRQARERKREAREQQKAPNNDVTSAGLLGDEDLLA